MISISQRAAPLPPDERRAALIASTLALVLTHGPDVTTRQIAQAAGVAEGTIFRVFATKDELVDAAITSAFDSAPLLRELAAVDRTASLHSRLAAAVEVLQWRTARIFRLVDALATGGDFDRLRQVRAEQGAVIRQMLTNLIEPDRDRLRCEPDEAARRLHILAIAYSHPRFVGDDVLPPAEIVSMLLDGIRLRPTSETTSPDIPSGESPC
ncbi:TetR/AcrR family transcriptional regulator [Streptosporangium sp. NPDC051022]|uniref:TetR/AcrR family transcriptional regulator n=1 Tax=Streptosporangium sp. NPDC051022 TaxID=3155752 RepID=UPI003446839B